MKSKDRTGQDRTGQDRTGQDRTGQDRTGQDTTVDPFVGVVLFVRSCEHIEQFEEYLNAIPQGADVHILSPLEDVGSFERMLSQQHRVSVHKTERETVASTAIMRYLAQIELTYRYLLVLRFDVSDRADYAATYKSMECLLKSPRFVQNVLDKFENEPRLGLLFPSPPNNDKYTSVMGREWIDFKDGVIELVDELGVAFDAQQTPVAPYFGMYWCRAQTMREILGMCPFSAIQKYENERRGFFEFWDIVIGLLAQKGGYYSAWSYNVDFAAIEITNTMFYLNKLIRSSNAGPKEGIWQIARRLRPNAAQK